VRRHFTSTMTDDLRPRDWPLSTADLPGSGGEMRSLEDFEVEELPAYLPAGEGEHCFAFVEKRGMTTPQAIERICAALGKRLDVGYAGLKDKAAITRQWISLPGVRPEELRALPLPPELRVLEAACHRNKLRTGHLRGNRFVVTLHGAIADGRARAERVLARLTTDGLPNYYGPQRFGRDGDNAERAARALRGEGRLPGDRFQRRLLVSALQSRLFDELLAERLEAGGAGLRRLVGGEVLQRTDSGGLFVSEEREVDEARLMRGEVVITGPICGPRMPLPKEGSAARALEELVLRRHGVTPDAFAVFGRLARGGRRPFSVAVEQASVEELAPGELRLRFLLPAGSYATVLLREVAKAATRP
jgi:tRNA pseudouridine13 synthase